MKTALSCCIIIVMIISGCTQQKSSKIEGSWKFVYAKAIAGDTIAYQIPGDYTGSGIKIWSKDHFAFVGLWKKDTATIDSYGGGTYTLNESSYKETINYHTDIAVVGKTIKMIIEIKNDTLYQSWPVDDNGKIDSANYLLEKYIRH